MVVKTNEFIISEHKVEKLQIKQMLAKHFPIKVIQSLIIIVNTCKHKMIEFVIENKKLLTKINGIIVIFFQYCYCWV